MTCLGIAIAKHGAHNVAAIGFHYGQRHTVELACAQSVCNKYGISFKIVDITFLTTMVTTALKNDETALNLEDNHPRLKDLPASFVPNRNALFLTIAHAHAQEIEANEVYTGVCQTDFSGYPDCRHEFIVLIEKALNVGYQCDIRIITPLMNYTKAETFYIADKLGMLDDIIELSHTCYNGVRGKFHRFDWGYGCGECPACELRRKGFMDYVTNTTEWQVEALWT